MVWNGSEAISGSASLPEQEMVMDLYYQGKEKSATHFLPHGNTFLLGLMPMCSAIEPFNPPIAKFLDNNRVP